ncbi:MAG: hypothetical protein KA128_06245 [Zoogloea sp.]|nr:hypothetical protein [Zoogloea sp.]
MTIASTSLQLMASAGRAATHAGQATIALTGRHAYFDKARQALIRKEERTQHRP